MVGNVPLFSYLLVTIFSAVNAGNLFVTTPSGADAQKLIHGIHCTKTTAATPVYTVDLRVKERDLGFRDDDGNIIHYDCEVIKYKEAVVDQDAVTPATLTACGNSKLFPTVDADQTAATAGPIDQSQQRTHHKTVTVTTDLATLSADGDIECGGWWDDTNSKMLFSAFCYREQHMNHQHDLIVHFEVLEADCDIDTKTSVDLLVDNPSETTVARDYLVTLKVYSLPVANLRNPWLVIEEQTSTNEVTAPVALGTTLYAEACIAIDGDSRQYFVDQSSYLGLKITNCWAAPDGTGQQFFDNPQSVQVTSSTGCGLSSSPMKAWATGVRQFKFARGDNTVANLPWFNSPNCFRTEAFEAVSFSRKPIDTQSTVQLTCDVDYCRDVTDSACFGDASYATADPPAYTCPTRRRRQTDNTTDEQLDAKLPPTVSFKYTVVTQFETERTLADEIRHVGCFNKTAFTSLTSILGVVSVLVIFADVILASKVRATGRKRLIQSDSSMASSNSASGFNNKAYF